MPQLVQIRTYWVKLWEIDIRVVIMLSFKYVCVCVCRSKWLGGVGGNLSCGFGRAAIFLTWHLESPRAARPILSLAFPIISNDNFLGALLWFSSSDLIIFSRASLLCRCPSTPKEHPKTMECHWQIISQQWYNKDLSTWSTNTHSIRPQTIQLVPTL